MLNAKIATGWTGGGEPLTMDTLQDMVRILRTMGEPVGRVIGVKMSQSTINSLPPCGPQGVSTRFLAAMLVYVDNSIPPGQFRKVYADGPGNWAYDVLTGRTLMPVTVPDLPVRSIIEKVGNLNHV